MRTETIDKYIEKLAPSLGGVHPPVSADELRKLYEKKNFIGMIQYVRDTLGLKGINACVGWVNKPPEKHKNSAAWIERDSMPPYGTEAFYRTRIIVCMQKSGIVSCSPEVIACTIAHEFSHIVLDAIGHELRREEVAVDLTAMLLGFRDLFRTSRQYTSVDYETTIFQHLTYNTKSTQQGAFCK